MPYLSVQLYICEAKKNILASAAFELKHKTVVGDDIGEH